MKKQIRRAMLCTVCMMLMGVVSLTGVTYAWFSESDGADVNGLSIEVRASEGGVYASTTPSDPTSFGSSVDISAGTDEYYPASTAGELNSDGTLRFFSGYLESPNDATVKVSEISYDSRAGSYVAQDVYFDNSSGGSEITISLAGTQIKPPEGSNKRTDLAVRVAIVTHGSLTQDEYNDGAGEFEATAESVQIYENNATEHTIQGENEWKKLTGNNTISNPKFDYYALNSKALTAEGNSDQGVNRFSMTSDYLTKMTTKTDPAAVTFTVPANSYRRITVYVWLEGQDADCQNNISGNTVNAAIRFTLS